MHLPSKKSLNFSYPVERGLQRFRELIIYISDKSKDDPDFGSVKLNKILYFADFIAYERFGVPLTGMVYQKLTNGPAPRALLPVRAELIEEGAIRLESVPTFSFVQLRTVALRKAITDLFFADEISLVDEIIADLSGHNATDVSLRSHDLRWKAVQLNDPIPYDFIYLDTNQLTDDDIRRSKELAGEFGWR
ncbi:hypothetical protein Mesau_00202 [Mesorhizobium australicum WSM2073]|uniref:Antitoxin SocA-like Panacea domain-containing protein n=1 Tax=Mesorhizobium australicum (strain HAMBI 3006 / LMG 24608 / WSM2073) TaxID=754035 RepID=L0KBL7_MESAW|nr:MULTISPECIES: Panacea domain-containing protein [Mesorhizobium]AGB42702.1 hypothetical protein Mesau_00202 [Mesorhizobium australicum WSM2073]MBZ9976139.1 SocA family protein [Mesorhizobium sp. BR-1-1-10]